jgi:hypothetical protein
VKLPVLIAIPHAVVTEICPSVTPVGAVALISLLFIIVNDALSPLKLTAVAPVKLLPFIVTIVPADPETGRKELITGIGCTEIVMLFETTVVADRQLAFDVNTQEITSPFVSDDDV